MEQGEGGVKDMHPVYSRSHIWCESGAASEASLRFVEKLCETPFCNLPDIRISYVYLPLYTYVWFQMLGIAIVILDYILYFYLRLWRTNFIVE